MERMRRGETASLKENGESGTKNHQVTKQSLTHRKLRSNSHKNDGVGTSRERAHERPHARNQGQPSELEVTELRGQDK